MDRQRIAEVFEQATEVPAAERAAWLATICGDDLALRVEVERLLRADASAAAFLERPPGLVREAAASAATDDPQPPRRFGVWRVLRPLGVGGMGEVWLAERSDGEFEQRAAIKQLAYPTPGLMQRFRQERQILARLEHPNIARLIDGGVDASGAPYLAMEYVDGVPITAHVREHVADVHACLRLFLRVCDAVHYAHQNLIVHRDLKPSNIFVTADGTPKLLDFGIAKVLATTDEAAATQTIARVLTPDYAAPEQFSGGTITTATDVYALGVVLYELLTNTRPWRDCGHAATRDTGPAGADTRPPSAAVDRTTGNAAARRRALRGDVDRIVLTALSVEPRLRYPSAEALAADIRRYLAGRPISARRDNVIYRVRKFARRHRYWLSAAAVVFGVSVGATFVSLQQAQRARMQATRAEQQAARAEEARKFLVGVFEQASPDRNQGRPLSAQQLLDLGAQQLSANPHGDVAIRADLNGLIGELYWDIGDYRTAEAMLAKAAAISASPLVAPEIRARNLQRLARMEAERESFGAAIGHAAQALAFAQRAGAAGYDDFSGARRVLVASHVGMGNAVGIEPLLRQMLAEDRAHYGERSQAVADDLFQLGWALKELSRLDEAIDISQQAVDIATALHGREHSSVIAALEALASAQGHRGALGDAERNLREATALAAKVFGPEHRETIIARSNLLWTLEMQGRYEEALQGRLQLLEIQKQLVETHPEQGAILWNFISSDYLGLGRFALAEDAARKSIAIWKSAAGDDTDWKSSDALRNLGTALQWQGRHREAEAGFREVMRIQARHEPPTSGWLNRSRGQLADVLRLDHRTGEALAEARAALAALPAPPASSKPDPIRIYLQTVLAEAELDAGDPTAAAKIAEDALAAARGVYAAGSVRLGAALFALARAELALKRPGEAETLLREALAVRQGSLPADDPRLLQVEVALVEALMAQGRTGEAGERTARIEPLLRASASAYARDLHARLRSR